MQEPVPANPCETPLGTTAVGLDAASLAQLSQLDPAGDGAFLKKVMSTYLGSLDKQLVVARVAREQQVWVTVATAAHTLKASSASVGALAFAQLCGRVEGRIRQGDLDGLGLLLDQFFEEAARTRVAVAAYLGIITS